MKHPQYLGMPRDSIAEVYAVVADPTEQADEVLFRKFENGAMFICCTNTKGEVIGAVHVSEEQLKAILAAPAIKVGDGKTPQTLSSSLELEEEK